MKEMKVYNNASVQGRLFIGKGSTQDTYYEGTDFFTLGSNLTALGVGTTSRGCYYEIIGDLVYFCLELKTTAAIAVNTSTTLVTDLNFGGRRLKYPTSDDISCFYTNYTGASSSNYTRSIECWTYLNNVYFKCTNVEYPTSTELKVGGLFQLEPVLPNS